MCEELCGNRPKKVVISGLFHGDTLGNYVYESGKVPRMVRERRVGSPRSGTGDVFCAIITGCAVNGVDFADSVAMASGFVARSIVRSEELGIPTTDGIAFEELLGELIPKK
jgi:pyridoxine kinase